MRKRTVYNWMIALGILLILGAGGLYLHNRREARRAGELSAQALEEILVIEQSQAAETTQAPEETQPEAETPTAPREMPVAEVQGKRYVGRLAIPALEVELPVMADWSYDDLKTAPCRYHGSVYTDNMVVCGHSYPSHFGNLSRLEPGDAVVFTCTDGAELNYTVAEVTVLEPTAVDEMISGEYPLSLFTCTKDSQARVTVRCQAVSQ